MEKNNRKTRRLVWDIAAWLVLTILIVILNPVFVHRLPKLWKLLVTIDQKTVSQLPSGLRVYFNVAFYLLRHMLAIAVISRALCLPLHNRKETSEDEAHRPERWKRYRGLVCKAVAIVGIGYPLRMFPVPPDHSLLDGSFYLLSGVRRSGWTESLTYQILFAVLGALALVLLAVSVIRVLSAVCKDAKAARKRRKARAAVRSETSGKEDTMREFNRGLTGTLPRSGLFSAKAREANDTLAEFQAAVGSDCCNSAFIRIMPLVCSGIRNEARLSLQTGYATYRFAGQTIHFYQNRSGQYLVESSEGSIPLEPLCPTIVQRRNDNGTKARLFVVTLIPQSLDIVHDQMKGEQIVL